MPNFLIIGAAKSGTTALFHNLRQHPEIFMSPRKETHFFAFEGMDPATNGPGDTIPNAITNLADYQALFQPVTDEKIVGEASPTYLYLPRAAARIKYHIPTAKMVVMLRNPVDRAYSAYMHLVRDGREPIADFAQALEEEEERIRKNWGPIWHYVKVGLYYEQVKRFYDLFDHDQIRIYLYEEFSQKPEVVLLDIFQFLKVGTAWMPDTSIRSNVSGIPRNKLMHQTMYRLFLTPNPIRTVSRKIFPFDLRWRVTTRLRNQNLRRKPLAPEIRAHLVERFRDDIQKLEALIQKDLDHWLQI